MRFFNRSLAGLFLLSLTIGFLALAADMMRSALRDRDSGQNFTAGSRERVFTVNTVVATSQDLRPRLSVFGELRSLRNLDVRAASSGRVVELTSGFIDGGRVEAGQLLLRVDPAEAASALARAETELEEAEANLRDAQREFELAGEELEATEAQAALRSAALSRQEDLRERGVGTEASVEAAALAASQASQATLTRRQALAQAEARIDNARTGLARRQLELADARRRLADTEIHAEFSGTLGEVSVVRGGLVALNERVAILTDPSALEVAFRVSTAQYARLLGRRSDGSESATSPLDTGWGEVPVEVVLDAHGVDLTSPGVVSRESSIVGEGQTGRLLFARLETPLGFRPGDFVTVSVLEPVMNNVVILPASAWESGSGDSGDVLAINPEGRLEKVETRLLRRQGNDVILEAQGLESREVVAQRTPLLGAGIRVRTVGGEPEAAASPTTGANPNKSPALIELSDERRAALITFVENNKNMPDAARTRVLEQLTAPQVPAGMVERIESRMGG